MSEARDQVKAVAESLGIEIDDSRLDQLAETWKQAMEESEAIRQESNPWPNPAPFDASWSDKR